MTIGLFSDTFPPDINGVATATKNLFDMLSSMGHTVYVITTNLEGKKEIAEKDHIIRIPGLALKKLYSYRMAGVFSKKVYSYLKKLRLDVIHIQTEAGIGTFGRITANLLDIPFVYTYHTMYADYSFYLKQYVPIPTKAATKIMSMFSKNWASSPDEMITTSQKTKKALLQYGVNRYINVIPNGFDFNPLIEKSKDTKEIDEIRNKYGLNGILSFCVVGRLGKEKGIDFLLHCLKRLIDVRGDKYKLLIVGNGGYKAELIKLTNKLGLNNNVIFVGAVEHNKVALYYCACDIIVSSSLTETQGLTVAEAMSVKSLVLVREDLNFKPLIIDGKTGFFYQNEDTFIEKVDLINSLSKEEIQSIKDAGFKKNKELNSLEAFGRSVEYVYKKARRNNW